MRVRVPDYFVPTTAPLALPRPTPLALALGTARFGNAIQATTHQEVPRRAGLSVAPAPMFSIEVEETRARPAKVVEHLSGNVPIVIEQPAWPVATPTPQVRPSTSCGCATGQPRTITTVRYAPAPSRSVYDILMWPIRQIPSLFRRA